MTAPGLYSGRPSSLRQGFTILEIAVVLIMAAVMMLLAFPRVVALQRRTNIVSARQQLESYIGVARLTAIRRGSTARVVRVGNTIKVTVDSSAAQATILRPFDFGNAYRVILSSTTDSIVYISRGTAKGLSTSGEKFYITADSTKIGSGKDSVCVTRLGLILDIGCGI